MPLVVPDTASGGDSQQWLSKLAGKKLGDKHDATIQSFARQDLPEKTRVIGPGQIITQDFDPKRMNVHVDQDGVVKNVDYK